MILQYLNQVVLLYIGTWFWLVFVVGLIVFILLQQLHNNTSLQGHGVSL